MSDRSLNYFLAQGTTAERTAFTPDPPVPAAGPSAGYLFFDTDTVSLWAWNAGAAAWEPATAIGGAGTLDADADGTLAADSDDLIATQKAVKTYVDTAVAGATGTYTDEKARDAVGAMFTDSTTIDVTCDDALDTEALEVIQSALKPTESLIVAAGDETTAITSGTGKVTFRMPYAFTVTAVRASLTTAQTSGSIFTVDINEAGTTILSTKLTIDNTEKTSTTAATAPVISDASLADDAEITVDIDQVGDGTAKGLKVVLIGHRT